jgi:hypothetical protein
VKSGELQKIVTANSPNEAADKAIDLAAGQTLDAHNFYVDERGWRGPDTEEKLPAQHTIPTDKIIKGWETEK